MKRFATKKVLLVCCAALLVLGYVVPETLIIPVQGATSSDWNPESFWYHPWGPSGVHKGIDVFAKRDTPVMASTAGWVLFEGHLPAGGNVAFVLGPKWRVHYYAHLSSSSVHIAQLVHPGEIIGTVGTTGNAAGKQPHLHYSIVSLFPYPWRMTREKQGWKKMFYLDPHEMLLSNISP